LDIEKVVNFVKKSGGIDYAQNKMREFYVNAIDILKSFPDNSAKESLLILAEYIISRDK